MDNPGPGRVQPYLEPYGNTTDGAAAGVHRAAQERLDAALQFLPGNRTVVFSIERESTPSARQHQQQPRVFHYKLQKFISDIHDISEIGVEPLSGGYQLLQQRHIDGPDDS